MAKTRHADLPDPESPDDSFRQFLEQEGKHLWRVALSFASGDRHLANDYHAETLARVYKTWDTVKHRNPVARAQTIMRNLHIDRWRREGREKFPILTDPVDFDLRPLMQMADTDQIDAKVMLAKAFRHLNRRELEVIFMRFYADETIEQTAKLLSIAPGTVKSYQSDAITKLRALIPGAEGVGK